MGGIPSGQGMSLSVAVLEAGCNASLRAALVGGWIRVQISTPGCSVFSQSEGR